MRIPARVRPSWTCTAGTWAHSGSLASLEYVKTAIAVRKPTQIQANHERPETEGANGDKPMLKSDKPQASMKPVANRTSGALKNQNTTPAKQTAEALNSLHWKKSRLN